MAFCPVSLVLLHSCSVDFIHFWAPAEGNADALLVVPPQRQLEIRGQVTSAFANTRETDIEGGSPAGNLVPLLLFFLLIHVN